MVRQFAYVNEVVEILLFPGKKYKGGGTIFSLKNNIKS